jgi:hypothetical protein
MAITVVDIETYEFMERESEHMLKEWSVKKLVR